MSGREGEAHPESQNGTGLTRLDQYNWIDEVGALADDPRPDLFLGSFGINDRQPIVEPDKTRTDFGGAAFDARYQAIVQEVVERAIGKGESILIVGLPVMLDPDANSDAQAKNKIFAAALDGGQFAARELRPALDVAAGAGRIQALPAQRAQ